MLRAKVSADEVLHHEQGEGEPITFASRDHVIFILLSFNKAREAEMGDGSGVAMAGEGHINSGLRSSHDCCRL